MPKITSPRPFVKWAGGKAQLTTELLKRAPSQFEDYYEPFVGGGAFFFALHRAGRVKKAFLSDLNAELVNAYIMIRDRVEDLIKVLSEHKHNKEFFLKIRKRNPNRLSEINRAARLIYLNKTCYNGLYRVNQKGQFNVPFGSYKSPKICDAENLRRVSNALSNVEIRCESFEAVVDKAGPDDFVYFDPPYEPLSKTAKFTSYQRTGFDQNAQKNLHDVCHQLSGKSSKFMLSNSSASLIEELYSDNGFYMHRVQAIRAINSNPKRRGKLTELIVTNYVANTT